ncbi:MAG: hypothetical protein V1783_09545 [Bacteroidota bacterium]
MNIIDVKLPVRVKTVRFSGFARYQIMADILKERAKSDLSPQAVP